MREHTFVVFDDDPTGTQLVADVPVLLDVTDMAARQRAFAGTPKAVHVVTNTRALPPADVYPAMMATFKQLRDVAANSPVILRGDSTLRAHLREEYEAVCDALYGARRVPLVLVPALPSAGRTTVNTVHMLHRDGTKTPLHNTEYATDGVFTYSTSHLLRYAAERSGGLFDPADGRGYTRQALHAAGPDGVADVLAQMAETSRACVFAPDIDTEDDLAIVADGVACARQRQIDTVVRAAPAYAAVAAGTRATALVTALPATGLIVMVGSYVPTTTRQLAAFTRATGITPVEADVIALSGANADTEMIRLAAAVDRQLAATRVAVVATPRVRPTDTANLLSGRAIATNLASVMARVSEPFDTVIAKGGITSTVMADVGLGARDARVVGPVLTGVALWQVERPVGTAVSYLVVPGNVGNDQILTDLYRLVTGTATPSG